MGHLDLVRFLLEEHGVDVNSACHDGFTALLCAARYGRADLLEGVIDLLVSAGADIDAPMAEGFTPLHLASKRRDCGDVTAILLQRGAAKDALTGNGRSPLHMAAECGNLAATRVLLAAGADATLRAHNGFVNKTPLDFAARSGHVEVIREFARHGVDLDAAHDETGCTALDHASRKNHAGAVDALVEAGARVTPQALDSAAFSLALEAMVALLRHGAPVNATTVTREDGEAAIRIIPTLHIAARRGGAPGAVEMVDLLLRWGADETRVNRRRQTAAEVVGELGDDIAVKVGTSHHVDQTRHAATGSRQEQTRTSRQLAAHSSQAYLWCEKLQYASGLWHSGVCNVAATLGLLSTVNNLLAEGVDASLRYGDNDQMSALDETALMGNLEVVRALLLEEHGVGVNDADPIGLTVLHIAVFHGRADVDLVDLLLSAGAYIDARAIEGMTPLHLATLRPDPDNAATILLRRGAAKDAITSGGHSPLHFAARLGHLSATRALLAAGADATLSIDSAFKDTALGLAACHDRVEVVREFVRYGVDLDAVDARGYTAVHNASRTWRASWTSSPRPGPASPKRHTFTGSRRSSVPSTTSPSRLCECSSGMGPPSGRRRETGPAQDSPLCFTWRLERPARRARRKRWTSS
ncbi:unnamed protein product [Laminaria digitata]